MILAWMCVTLLAGVLAAPGPDCSPSALQVQSSRVRNMCALYQISSALQAYLDEQNNYQTALRDTNIPYNIPEKRQDIDHVFMRFGRRR
ncbi:neuropeptide receptor myosuppressin [Rhodnius prolixus]|uniref:Myosuppressin n=1 Tax=Rhodnius prolixus TaxID=13249 RepID=C7FDI3_RHOPR|nr:myosuppressin precursor [Rhodnius prolixus]AEX08672.1 myosuppressin prepropeptide [Rhodnius prolixus]